MPNRSKDGSKRAQDGSLRARLGPPPTNDSLAVVSWTIRALGELARELLDQPGLSKDRRRAELLKLAGAMAKLRDPDRIYRAERALVEADEQMADSRQGPELVDAGDLAESSRRIATRRGSPRRGSLR